MAVLCSVASVEVCGMLSTWCAEVCNQQFVAFVCMHSQSVVMYACVFTCCETSTI